MMRTISITIALALLAQGGMAATGQSGAAYRDLNHNGRMDPYEDGRLTDDVRVTDLLSQMSVEEKVGTLLHGTLPAINSPFGASSEGYDLPAIEKLIGERGITSMISRLTMNPADFARQNNAVQALAERSRLGIPITISTDPRNHFSVTAGASVAASGFTQWPETLGLAALGNADVVRRMGSIAAHEYRAVGLHMALSPQADLATEPRWARGIATFGADPVTVSRLAGAYVEGFQGSSSGLTRKGVATVVKHFAGYGAEPEGFDAHNAYGAHVRLTNDSFARHLSAFDDALKVKSAGIMPTYAIIEGVTWRGNPIEPVGAGFSRILLDDILRKHMGYGGLVVSDWGIANDCPTACSAPTAQNPQSPMAIGMPWGVETLSVEDRTAKAVVAGIDQFGGLDDPAALLAAVRDGKIPVARLDQAARRALLVKFQLGLFDQPFVDEKKAAEIVGNARFSEQAAQVQRDAQVLLENKGGILPLKKVRKLWVQGVDPAVVRAAGLEVVSDPALADAALIRMSAPADKLHPHHFFGAMQNEGRLDFRDGDKGFDALKQVAHHLPTVVAVDLDRPAILTNVRDKADGLVALFGASDAALVDVVLGRATAKGRLPVELPRSAKAVAAQRPDLSNDSVDPLYPVGAGIIFKTRK